MSKFKHRLRKTAADRLSSVLPYTAYDISPTEYLGHFDGSHSELVAQLKERGYHYQMFAAEKRLGSKTDNGSYACIPDRHPEAVHKTALEGIDPRNCQYHVHLFDLPDGVDVYGHYEIHPYPWTPYLDWNRPLKHYRPTWDTDDNPRSEWTYLRGVTDQRLKTLLSERWVTKQRTH